jgi:hypothetical protein
MGSSGNTNYKQPKTPAPPADMIAGQGQTAGFTPSFINFLGDTNVPSTGLTPEMIAQIDATNGAPRPPALGGGMGEDRGLLAQIMARLDAMQQPERGWGGPRQRQHRGGSGGGGYTTSGREGAGGFGSRSSSASRAGGGLY